MWPEGRFWTVPNVLSLSRLLLLPLFLYALMDPKRLPLAALLVVYGILSDVFDGYLARRLNQVSEWGKLIDPLADKITVAAALLFCYFMRGLPLWILLLILGRDLVILLFSPFLAGRLGSLPTSNLTGRLAALSFGLLALVYILRLEKLQAPALVLAAALLILSSLLYLKRVLAHADQPLHS